MWLVLLGPKRPYFSGTCFLGDHHLRHFQYHRYLHHQCYRSHHQRCVIMMNASVKWPYAAHSLWVLADWPYTKMGYPDGNQVTSGHQLVTFGHQRVTSWSLGGTQVLSILYPCDVQAVSIRLTCGQELSECLCTLHCTLCTLCSPMSLYLL